MTAEDLAPNNLGFSPICASVALPPRRWPMSRTATCHQRQAAEKTASVGQNGLERGIMFGSSPVVPATARHLVPSIVALGTSTMTGLLFHRAAFPGIEMLFQVTRNRLEGEASVGHEPGLHSSKREAHSNCVSNVMTSNVTETWVGWVSPSASSTVSPEHTSPCRLRGGLGATTF